jgi:hypothetical protein
LSIAATFLGLPIAMTLVAYSSNAEAQDGTSSNSEHSVAAAYEFYGRAPYPAYARGGRVAYIFNNRQELSLSYIDAKQHVLLTSYRYSEYALMLSFWMNHYIYFTVGTGNRTVTIDAQVFVEPINTNDVAASQQVHAQYKMLTANAALGFEIPIFANFVIGTEIFGLSSPIHSLKKSSNYPENATEFEEDPKSYPYIRDGLRTNYHLMRSFVKVRL